MKNAITLLTEQKAMPNSLKVELYEMGTEFKVPKFGIIHRRGIICDRLYFIEKGLAICYDQKTGERKKYCTWAYKELDIITSVDSFETGKASTDEIIALEDCHLWWINKKQFDYLTGKYKAFEGIRRKLYEKYHRYAREMEAMKQRPPEVFFDYLKNSKEHKYLTERLPVKHLAAFMGISKASLHKIKQGQSSE